MFVFYQHFTLTLYLSVFSSGDFLCHHLVFFWILKHALYLRFSTIVYYLTVSYGAIVIDVSMTLK